MPNIRLATAADAGTIGEHRVLMFADAGLAQKQAMEPMRASFVPWVREKLEDGSYIGWLAEDDGRVVGGAGLWLMEWPPHYLHPEPCRAYLLNFYVAPDARRQGLARFMFNLALEEARRRGLKIASLHASKFGRPLYEQSGFTASNEMLLRLTEPSSD